MYSCVIGYVSTRISVYYLYTQAYHSCFTVLDLGTENRAEVLEICLYRRIRNYLDRYCNMIVYLKRMGIYHLHRLIRYSHSQSTVIEEEISRFNRLSVVWWDEQGDMKPLHSMNGLRVKMIVGGLVNSGKIKEQQLKLPKPLTSIKLLDVGCGGGILSEALARLGGEVTGLDASEALITTAKHHASQDPYLMNKIDYVSNRIEKYSEEKPGVYDVVVASEVVEHISEKKLFLESCVHALKPGGSLFVTTLNKTYASHLAGIVLAEIIWKIVPKNTHDWEKFITPQELESTLESCGCKTVLINGLFYNIFANKWSWTQNTSISYALHAIKR